MTALLRSGIWAMEEAAFADLQAAIADGVTPQRQTAAQRIDPRTAGSVAVIPITGVISPETSWITMLFGGTTPGGVADAVRMAAADASIKGIVLRVDSPGGNAQGVAEAADAIYAARGSKPILAVADGMMCSAAYWLASQADEVIASPSAELGSIGVYTVHYDQSAAYAQAGISPTIISAGRYKAETSPLAPLADAARAAIQQSVDDVYDMFIAAVARGRGVSVSDVRAGYGEGRALMAKRAVAAGLADRVATFEETLARFGVGPQAKGRRAADESAAARYRLAAAGA